MILAVRGGEPALSPPITYPWPKITPESRDLVMQQLESGKLSIYDKSGVVGSFEDSFAEFHNRPYALVTSSGTAALHSCYYGLGLGPGDEVLCPTYTFFATATPLFQLGALPVLVDCTPTGGMDVRMAESLVTPRTRAVVVTHMWGHPCDMDAVISFCRTYHLALIEDCSHAHGASYGGRLVGTFGDAAAWSLQTQKLIAAGEGGIMLTAERAVYDKAQLLGHFNKRAQQEMDPLGPFYKYATTGSGLKYRAHPLGIAFALGQLPYLENWVSTKQESAHRLISIFSLIPGALPLAESTPARRSAYYALPIRLSPPWVACRQQLVTAIQAEGFLDIDIPQATAPLHTLPLFQDPISPVYIYDRPCMREQFPEADAVARSTIKVSVPAGAGPNAGEEDERFLSAFEIVVRKLESNEFDLDQDRV